MTTILLAIIILLAMVASLAVVARIFGARHDAETQVLDRLARFGGRKF